VADTGLTRNQVRERISNAIILVSASGQKSKFHFSPNVQVTVDRALGMLMRLAAKGEWRNPPLMSIEYERVSRNLRRLRKLLQALVNIPGDPFKKRHQFTMKAMPFRSNTYDLY
jgi:hypothetical protein